MRAPGPRLCALLLSASVLLPWSGCRSALLQKAEPLSVRYFAPRERALTRTAGAKQTFEAAVRLGRVSAAAHLDVRFVTRRNSELEFHDALRWSDRPAQYLENALAHALFEEQGLSPALSGRAFTLEARLSNFEEVIDQGAHALVTIVWTLHDERQTMVYETTRCGRPLSSLPGGDGDVLVAALTQALDECVDRIATQVVEALRRAVEGAARE